MLEGFIGELTRVVVCVRFMTNGVWADVYGKIEISKNEKDQLESLEGVAIECMDKILEYGNKIKPVHITSLVISNEMCRFSQKIKKISLKISGRAPQQFSSITISDYKASKKLIRFIKKICENSELDELVTVYSETEMSDDETESRLTQSQLRIDEMKEKTCLTQRTVNEKNEQSRKDDPYNEQHEIKQVDTGETKDYVKSTIKVNDELKKSHKSWHMIVNDIHKEKEKREKRDNCKYKVIYHEMFPIVFYYKMENRKMIK